MRTLSEKTRRQVEVLKILIKKLRERGDEESLRIAAATEKSLKTSTEVLNDLGLK